MSGQTRYLSHGSEDWARLKIKYFYSPARIKSTIVDVFNIDADSLYLTILDLLISNTYIVIE